MIRGGEPGIKASIKLLQYVFALTISGAGFATMLNPNRQSDSFRALEVAPYISNHIPGGTSAQISARHAQYS
jgi:hypothetical protein